MERKEIENLMQAHGIRPTANRISIALALSRAGRPMSLGELEDNLDTIDKSGISRALTLFRGSHMVHVIEDGSDSVRYELCLSESEHHDSDEHVHFYCEKCGKTFCLNDISIPSVALPSGWTPTSTNYMIKGVCPACSQD
ncbi:MAG: transcriptional repressor [Bacteroidales bacterium]|nr:transcriptional repressor [Bacteroidales bacterium]